MRDEQKAARAVSNKIRKALRPAVMRTYIKSADAVAAEIKILKTKAKGTTKYSLTIESKTKLEASLRAEAKIIKNSVNTISKKGVSAGIKANAGRYSKYTNGFLTKYTDLNKQVLTDIFIKVNTDLIEVQVAKAYGDGLKFSRRIWKSSEKFKTDLRNVVSEGLARNRDIVDISKDINVYVRTNKKTLAKRYANIDKSPIRSGETVDEWKTRVNTFKSRISKDLEYNSLRIVRSMTQGAIQDSNIVAASYTPSVQSFNWTLSPAHIVYSICEDIEAGNPWTYESFVYGTPPHPNCLSYVTYNEIPQREFVNDLKRWTKSPTASGTDYLNNWKSTYYDPMVIGNKDNYFDLLIKRTNKSALKKVA